MKHKLDVFRKSISLQGAVMANVMKVINLSVMINDAKYEGISLVLV